MFATTRRLAFVALLALTFLAPLQAAAAETVHLYLNISGEAVDGGSVVPGMEGAIDAESFSMKVGTKTPDSARAAARREMSPVTIMKRIDQTTPLLYEAWAENHLLESAEIRFTRTGEDGTLEHYYTVTLERGRIVGIDTKPAEGDSSEPPLEEIQIVFHQIEWTWEETGDSASTTWVEQP